LAYLKHDIKYSENLKEKWKEQVENSLLEYHDGFQYGRSCIDPLFSMKLLIEKGRDFSLENHLEFFDFVKACDKVKRGKLFEIL
jgi:hypothetical protein